MKNFSTLNTVKTGLLVSLIAFTLACGYSKSTMPTQAGAMPNISQLNPASATSGSAAIPLEVDGTNFASHAAVNFKGAAQTTTFVSSTKLMTTIPASAMMNTGTVPVTVTNPAVAGGLYGGGTMAETSSPMNFMIN